LVPPGRLPASTTSGRCTALVPRFNSDPVAVSVVPGCRLVDDRLHCWTIATVVPGMAVGAGVGSGVGAGVGVGRGVGSGVGVGVGVGTGVGLGTGGADAVTVNNVSWPS